MTFYTTRPIKELESKDFRLILHNQEIIVSPHAFDHIAEAQRKVFKEEDLICMVAKENPRKVYLQENGRYAAYYRKSDGYRKLIIEKESAKITIVSFMDLVEIPRLTLP